MAHGGRDPTPVQWVYQTRSYGFKIRYTTPTAGKIQWIRDKVLYPGTRVQMSQLRSMVHGLIGEARDNPVLWWVGILVQSSLQAGADDYISRGRFNVNVLPMDQDIRARFEALLHSKVLVLDYTMATWQTSKPRQIEVRGDMAAIDLSWINADDDQRRRADAYKHDCGSEAWKDILTHLQRQCSQYLAKEGGTVVGQLRLLLDEKY
ncbi:hypothetical protein V500_02554 [Pseudogymnoascus sp. VKM F-4518 (FW-2643)]|nr:hypothetical protein V500_02554 [Pseudogymnoascus sp. VKM F-4518 (FW-2643)]